MYSGILELTSKVKYGFTSRNVPIYLFRPLNPDFPPCIAGSSHRDISTNVLAIAKIDDWNLTGLTRANIVQILGKCGDYDAERKALLAAYCSVKPPVSPFMLKTPTSTGRILIEGRTFNIDPAGCTDIDDVITINGEEVSITIADVAEWFKLNPNLTVHQGQTFYMDGKVVRPMLAFENACSLLPGVERPGLSLTFTWRNNQIYNLRFEKSWIKNGTSYSYQNVPYIPIIQEIASHLAGRPVNDSHEWVEQLMLFYNMEVAKRIEGGVYRAHDEPDLEKLKKYEAMGLDVRTLAFKSAHYCGEKTPHYGLKLDVYCHASSPIRRYADIVNQAILKGDKPPDFNIQQLNTWERQSKRYERDMFFLEALLHGNTRQVEGIAVSSTRVWVPVWKRMVSCKNEAEGKRGILHFSLDMNQPTWKKRMVFRFVDRENPAPQPLE